MAAPGRFITFEGGEGAGKSTQVRRLTERLRVLGHEVVETREPGGSPGAEAMRHLLLAGIAKPLGSDAEAMLFAAAREDHVTSAIRPALAAGAWVICDRFLDSTRVYQGVLGGVDERLVRALERVTVGDTLPDLTFVLDVPPEVGLARAGKRGQGTDRFESEDLAYHERLRQAFRQIAENEPNRCILIDGTINADVLAVRIWMAVADRLLRKRAAKPAALTLQSAPAMEPAPVAPPRPAPAAAPATVAAPTPDPGNGGRVKEKDEAEEGDRFPGAPHPRERTELYGHAETETAVVAAFAQGRLPHAWLIGGLEGIGKATLAYRIARFVLSNPDRGASTSLAVPPDHPASRQIAALSHPDLLVLRRAAEDGKKLPSEIPAAQVRKSVGFFGSTAAYGGYRVCIVDSVDEMNRFGANALLKVLEEPPPRSLLLIVSHTPGRVLATIRSRCQRLMLRPLSTDDVTRTLHSLAPAMDDLPQAQIAPAAEASGGSVRHALALLMGEGLEVRNLTREAFARLPATDGLALHALGDRMAGDAGSRRFRRDRGGLARRRGATDRPSPRVLRAMPRHGRRSAAPRPTPRFSGSIASHSCSRSSPCSPRRPAARTAARSGLERSWRPSRATTSPPRFPTPMARRTSATPTRRSPPTRSRASSASTATTSSS